MATVMHRVSTVFFSMTIAALAGCGHSTPAATSTTTNSSHATWGGPSNPPDPKILLRVGATAVGAVPNGTLTFIRPQATDSWRVLVATPDGTEQSMDVSFAGADVIAGPTPKNQSDADKAQTRARLQAAHVDYRAAMDKILAAIPSGSVSELSLTDSNATTVWQAVAWDLNLVEHKVTINATTGDVLANKQV